MKSFVIILIWILSLIIVAVYVYENPERIDVLKYYFKPKIQTDIKTEKGPIQKVPGNSFLVQFSKEIPLSERTAFIIHEENIKNFNPDNLKIYTQNGNLLKNFKSEKINLPSVFTTKKNGGIKTVFIHNNKEFALVSSSKNECYYASIVSLSNGKELFKTQCLPDKKVDYNGLGSSHIHHNNKIYLSIGAPEQASTKIRDLAQNQNSVFGKIIVINSDDLEKIIKDEKENSLKVKIFTMGHRNPQGFTKINEHFFSVEHGPRGGDELNKILENKNYGWPKVSYGTKYSYDDNAKAYEISHENNQFEEPLFAFVPSIGISALNVCPAVLKKFYKKPCLLALSLYGNSQRPGRSLIIYLLNKDMDKIHSVEKIFLRDDLKLRHFVTNQKNELYEDKNGDIYVSADKKGIYKISFIDFRN